MPKAPPSFQFYPSDFISGTLHLEHQAIACYLLLLCFQWMHGKLPSNIDKLARICRLEYAEFPPVWGEIADKFVETGDGYLINERLENTRNKAFELSEKRAESGRKGGQAIAKQLPKQKGKQKGKQKQSKGRLKTEDRSLKSKDRKQKSEEPFERFWRIVPKKVGKKDCRKHYAAAVKDLAGRVDDPHEHLYRRMGEYADSDKARSKYGWGVRTWLRDGHYDDDTDAWREHELTHNQKIMQELFEEENANEAYDTDHGDGGTIQARLIESRSEAVFDGGGRFDG